MRRRQDLNAESVAAHHWLFGLPGGPLMDLSPHPLSILLQLLGNVERVWTVKKSSGFLPYGLPDELRVLMEAEAAIGSLVLSLGTQPDCFTVNIYGTEMTAHVNLTNLTLVKRKNRSVSKKLSRLLDNFDQAFQLLSHSLVNSVAVALGRKPPPGDLGAIISQFYRSIEDDLAPPVSGEEGKAVVKLMNDIWQQAA
jgi:predicted dehydrogenase